jgi:hypothetical protein
MVFHNWTIVSGKLLNTATENNTDVEISFRQHFLITLILFTHIFKGIGFLIAILSGISSNPSLYLLGGMLIALGIALWIGIQKKFEMDILKYKTLISKILAS